MAGEQDQRDLFPNLSGDEHTVVINDRCLIRTQLGHRLVIVAGIVLAQYAVDDRMAEAHAMVSLVEQGWADQNDVARAFGRSPRTLRRYERRVETGGLVALGRLSGYPAGRPRLASARLRLVARLKAQGLSNRAVAQRVGVSENAVRKLLRRLGWRPTPVEQERLPLGPPPAHPNLSAFSCASQLPPPAEPSLSPPPELYDAWAGAHPNLAAFDSEPHDLPVSFDADPADRRLDRLLAYLGLLDDAAPLFRSGKRIPRAGVLLALPALVASDVFVIAREVYGSLGPAFYGLRTTVVALLLMGSAAYQAPGGPQGTRAG